MDFDRIRRRTVHRGTRALTRTKGLAETAFADSQGKGSKFTEGVSLEYAVARSDAPLRDGLSPFSPSPGAPRACATDRRRRNGSPSDQWMMSIWMLPAMTRIDVEGFLGKIPSEVAEEHRLAALVPPRPRGP